MEDAHIAHYNDKASVFAVFDGHGGKSSSIQVPNAQSTPQSTFWNV